MKPPRLLTALALCLVPFALVAQDATYLGFDRNLYPGDANLKTLHQTFSYSGYWLNNPPGERSNTWTGHRAAVESAGLGFLVLYNGRVYAELKSVANAAKLGKTDAQTAAATARVEGFPDHTVIFLDQEQGGRMLPEQKAYIYAWVDSVIAAGFRAGVYCSGIASKDDDKIITAEDIRASSAGRQIIYWAINDACPPAPGCILPVAAGIRPPAPAKSGVSFAEVWQFAQSPQRKDVAGYCTNYNHDGNCDPPQIPPVQQVHVDLNSATSPDPSGGRSH